MTDPAPLTEDDVKRFMERWYLELLDTHAPAADVVACVADDAEMRFPEATVKGINAFRDWYDRIVHTFFDEVHQITRQVVAIADDGQSAEVKIELNWQARTWIPPEAKSRRIGFDAGHTHEVRRSASTGEPVIQVYGVDTFAAMPGSSHLPVLAREVIGQYYGYVNAGDWSGSLTLMDDALVVDDQIDGHVEGKSDILGIGEQLRKVYSKFLVHPQHIVVQGEEAAVVWQNESANAAGVPISATGCTYFQIKEGKITYMRTIHDTVPFKPMTDQEMKGREPAD